MRTIAALVLLVTVATPPPSLAETPTHLPPVHVSGRTPNGEAIDLNLPAGVYLSADHFARVDAEVRRLQDSETKLTAENKSLRASVESTTKNEVTGAIVTGVLCLAVGVAIGVYLKR